MVVFDFNGKQRLGDIMDIKILYDKILGCFNGKNIGGTLGAPLESKNGFFNVD